MRNIKKKNVFLIVFVVCLMTTIASPVFAEDIVLDDGQSVSPDVTTSDVTTNDDSVSVEATIETVDDVAVVNVDVSQDETVTATDLGVSEPTILPDSKFYFFKNWGRAIQEGLTFNKAKKAELQVRNASVRLLEAKKLAEKTDNEAIVTIALENYNTAMDAVKTRVEQIQANTNDPRVSQFLDNFMDAQIKHQKLIDGLVSGEILPEEAKAKFKEARDKSIEKFADVVSKVEDPEKLQERLQKIVEKQSGGKFKNFKNAEVLERISEKLPENAKEAVLRARDRAVERLQENLDNMTPEDQAKLKAYISNIGGNALQHAVILDKINIENLPDELKAKIENAKEIIADKVKDRLENMDDSQKEKYLEALKSGDVDHVKVLETLKARLPENLRGRINDIKNISEEKLGERLQNMTDEQRQKMIERAGESNGKAIEALKKAQEKVKNPEAKKTLENALERVKKRE